MNKNLTFKNSMGGLMKDSGGKYPTRDVKETIGQDPAKQIKDFGYNDEFDDDVNEVAGDIYIPPRWEKRAPI
jgi:hypothetical protein